MSDGFNSQEIDELRGALVVKTIQAETLALALERVLWQFQVALKRLPVRCADEAIMEANTALRQYRGEP